MNYFPGATVSADAASESNVKVLDDMDAFLEISSRAAFELSTDVDVTCSVNVACTGAKAKYMITAHSACALTGDETAKMCCEKCLPYDTFHDYIISENGSVEKINKAR